MPTALELLAASMRPQPMSTPMDPRLAAQQEAEQAALQPQDFSQMVSRAPAQQPEIEPGPAAAVQAPQPMSEMEKVMAGIQQREDAKRRELEKYLSKARGGMSGLEEALRLQLGQKAQLDLSPLAALSDSLSGGKLLAGYQKPPTSQQAAQQNLGNLESLQQRREALATLAAGAGKSSVDELKLMMHQEKAKETQGRYDDKKATVTDKQADDINKFDTLTAETNDLKNTLQADFVGPLNQYKDAPIVKNFHPDAANYLAKLGRLVDKYRTMVTGSAAADKELQMIVGRMPKADDSPELFAQKAAQVIEDTERARQIYLGSIEKKGKDVSGYRGDGHQSDEPKAAAPQGQGKMSFEDWKKSKK